jgi:hypothetical protein
MTSLEKLEPNPWNKRWLDEKYILGSALSIFVSMNCILSPFSIVRVPSTIPLIKEILAVGSGCEEIYIFKHISMTPTAAIRIKMISAVVFHLKMLGNFYD